ncbi:hypothetical protein QBC43DRAFT_359026 [Cladorrhinum sp. PSN259]|nr:hypothetical protein QBC43DRAFT_359026 [Cladorrhinum sp. PSN259]
MSPVDPALNSHKTLCCSHGSFLGRISSRQHGGHHAEQEHARAIGTEPGRGCICIMGLQLTLWITGSLVSDRTDRETWDVCAAISGVAPTEIRMCCGTCDGGWNDRPNAAQRCLKDRRREFGGRNPLVRGLDHPNAFKQATVALGRGFPDSGEPVRGRRAQSGVDSSLEARRNTESQPSVRLIDDRTGIQRLQRLRIFKFWRGAEPGSESASWGERPKRLPIGLVASH